MSAVPAPDTGPDAGAVWHYGDPLGEQRAAMDEAVVVDRSHRVVLTLTGGDRQSWLHNISTQHVSELPDGTVTQNLSLDGQGRVEDHWIQTELGGVTYLDTESWRGEPLLAYLRKMVFWSDVAIEPADLAVLSLLGPRLADEAVLGALGIDSLPAEVDCGGARRRRFRPPGRLAGHRAGPRGATAAGLRLAGPVDCGRRAAGRRMGVRGASGGGAAPAAGGRHRRADDPTRGGLDRRARCTWTRAATAARKPSRGSITWASRRECWSCCTSTGPRDRPATGDPVLAGGRAVGRLGTVVDHVDLGPISLALLKRGLPADTALTTGGEVEVPAVIDADSMPAADAIGAGRLAVERLRGGAR